MRRPDDFDLSPAEEERIRTIQLFLDSEPDRRGRMPLRNPVALLPVVLIVALVVAVAWFAPPKGSPQARTAWWPALMLPVISALGVVTVVLGMRSNRRGRWRAMRAAGHPICIGCGYRLDRRAPGSDRCPECGRADAEQQVRGWPPAAAREPAAEASTPEEPTS